MPNLGPTELIIIGVILILLFGAKKLPDAARGLGRSLRIFKSETAKLRDDDETDTHTATHTATVVQAQQPAPAPQPLPTAPTAQTAEEQARALEEQAAKLRAQAGAAKPQ
ncbi:Sec-independent protein translocase subunit TatA [Streptosporangium sp. NPDC000239]|uniref:Sec-independent protein translocase protein TatA n=1 Tax=Streptosporangium jomthongense TaxID=1193683 RepID=A0ABV8F2G5_9ACTN